MVPLTQLDARTVVRALRGGPATLDALAARLGGPDRDALVWALGDAQDRGWVASTAQPDCGPDGVCGDAPPTLFSATPEGRGAAS